MQIRPDSLQGGTLSVYTQQMERAQAERPREAKASEGRQDRVSLSDEARLMAEAAHTANTAPDVRAERVAELKARVDNGTYSVDNRALAAAIVRDDLSI